MSHQKSKSKGKPSDIVQPSVAGSNAGISFIETPAVFMVAREYQPFGMNELFEASGLSPDQFIQLAESGTSGEMEPAAELTLGEEADDATVDLIVRGQLWGALALASDILKEEFGAAAYINATADFDDEKPMLVLEAHLAWQSNDLEALVTAQDRFIERYVRELDTEERAKMRLAVFVTD
jgi:hypothetical protein